MTPLTLLVLAALAVALAWLVRTRGDRVSAPPPVPAPSEPPVPPPSPAARPAEVVRRLDEHVQFTVYRPRRLPPETWSAILAFAHLAERRADAPPGTPDPVEEVRRQAQEVLGGSAGSYAGSTQDSRQAIPHAGDLTFVLDLPGVEVNPPERTFRWLEDVHREEFRVRAPAGLDGRTVRGALRVHLGALLIAEVTLAVDVGAATGDATEAEHARPYRRIFPSYSHRDEAIVRQVEAYARTMGDEYLRDVTQLRAGELWDERLMEFIRTADVFQLFWSHNSMRSPWVRQEWEYALSLGRPHFVRPTYWEMPMPAAPERDLPPASLRALHFQRLPLRVERADDEDATMSGRSPTPVPAKRRRRFPTALAALLLVGFVGSTLLWRTGRIPFPVPPSPSEPAVLEAVSPDGTRVASMGSDGRIRIAAREQPGPPPLVIATSFQPSQIAVLRFSADGERVVCELHDGTTVEWDARTGARVAHSGIG